MGQVLRKQKKEMEALIERVEELERQLALKKKEKKVVRVIRNKEEVEGGEREEINVGVSTEQIKLYVEQLLKDGKIDIKYVPDAVETALYNKVFEMLLEFLNKTSQENSISLLGHELKFFIVPKN